MVCKERKGVEESMILAMLSIWVILLIAATIIDRLFKKQYKKEKEEKIAKSEIDVRNELIKYKSEYLKKPIVLYKYRDSKMQPPRIFSAISYNSEGKCYEGYEISKSLYPRSTRTFQLDDSPESSTRFYIIREERCFKRI